MSNKADYKNESQTYNFKGATSVNQIVNTIKRFNSVNFDEIHVDNAIDTIRNVLMHEFEHGKDNILRAEILIPILANINIGNVENISSIPNYIFNRLMACSTYGQPINHDDFQKALFDAWEE